MILCSNLFSIESKTLSHINGHNDRRYQNVYKNKQYLFKVKRSADWPLKTLYNSLTKDLSTENESVGGQSLPYNSQQHRWEIHWYQYVIDFLWFLIQTRLEMLSRPKAPKLPQSIPSCEVTQRNSKDSKEFQLLKSQADLQISKDSKGYKRIPRDSKGFQRIPKDSKGFQRIPKDSEGF